MHITSKTHTRKGSALIETLVGLSIVMMAMTGIISLVTRALSLNSDSANRLVAAGLAGEGLELAKYYLTSDWNKVTPGVYELTYKCDVFSSTCANNLGADLSMRSIKPLNIDANNMYSYDAGTPTTFKRSVIIDWGSESAEVASIVSWNFKGDIKEIQVADKFYRWHR